MDFRYGGPMATTTSIPIEASGKVSAVNNASRKVGAMTSSGDADIQAWAKCVNAQIARESCPGGYKIMNIDGCRVSNGYDYDRSNVSFLVPDTIKAPMSQSGKITYTTAYDDLKNTLYQHKSVDGNKELCNKLVPEMNGGKRRGKKRVKKTRGKKRVKKTRTRRKRVKKTRGKKKSKSKGTRKRSYRRRR